MRHYTREQNFNIVRYSEISLGNISEMFLRFYYLYYLYCNLRSEQKNKKQVTPSVRSARVVVCENRSFEWEVNVKRFEPVGCVLCTARGDPVTSRFGAAAAPGAWARARRKHVIHLVVSFAHSRAPRVFTSYLFVVERYERKLKPKLTRLIRVAGIQSAVK